MALVGASGAVDQVGGRPEAAGSIGSGGGSIWSASCVAIGSGDRCDMMHRGWSVGAEPAQNFGACHRPERSGQRGERSPTSKEP